MSKVEREIRKLQRSTKLLASLRAFKECIKNLLANLKDGTGQLPTRIAANNAEGLQSAPEDLKLIYLCTLCARWNKQRAGL